MENQPVLQQHPQHASFSSGFDAKANSGLQLKAPAFSLQSSPIQCQSPEGTADQPKMDELPDEYKYAGEQDLENQKAWDGKAVAESEKDGLDVTMTDFEGTSSDYSVDYQSGGETFSMEAYFFQGQSDKRAMVVGGIHGSERSGVQVAEELIKQLEASPTKPYYSVVVVPKLFGNNYDRGDKAYRKSDKAAKKTLTTDNEYRYTRVCREGGDIVRKGDKDVLFKGDKLPKSMGGGKPAACSKGSQALVDPNRQAPALGKGVDHSKPLDAEGRPIEPENVMLIGLVNRFRPSRIAMLHAVHGGIDKSMHKDQKAVHDKDKAGIYVDPRTEAPPAPGTDKAYDKAAKKAGRKKQMGGKALDFSSDQDLGLRMAEKAESEFDKSMGGSSGYTDIVKGNLKGTRSDPNNTDLTSPLYPLDPDVAKPGDYQVRSDNGGTSYGAWFATEVKDSAHTSQNRPALQTVTMEVGGRFRSDERGLDPAHQKARLAEIQAMATSLQEIFLGPDPKKAAVGAAKGAVSGAVSGGVKKATEATPKP